jgi:Uma2 family endonuclease
MTAAIAFANTPARPRTLDEFRLWQEGQEARHEFRNGEITMMTGGTRPHARVARRFTEAFQSRLKGHQCEAFQSELLVETDVASGFFPDVVVDCEPHAPDQTKAGKPTVVVEVLSPSTRDRDLSAKLPDYRDTASIMQIIMAEADIPLVRVWTRTELGWRESRASGLDRTIDVPSLGISIPMVEIYAEA